MERQIFLRGGDPGCPFAQGKENHRPEAGVQLRSELAAFTRMLIPVFLFAAILATPMSPNAEPAKGLGMWVWSNSAFSTLEARQQLVHFCVKHRIRHLDVHVKMSRDRDKPILQDAEALKDLILLAGQYDITTAALRGHPKMFLSKNHDRALR